MFVLEAAKPWIIGNSSCSVLKAWAPMQVSRCFISDAVVRSAESIVFLYGV